MVTHGHLWLHSAFARGRAGDPGLRVLRRPDGLLDDIAVNGDGVSERLEDTREGVAEYISNCATEIDAIRLRQLVGAISDISDVLGDKFALMVPADTDSKEAA